VIISESPVAGICESVRISEELCENVCFETASVALCDVLSTKSSPNRAPSELLKALHRPLPMVGPEGESKTTLFSTGCCRLSSQAWFGSFLVSASLSASPLSVLPVSLPRTPVWGSTLLRESESETETDLTRSLTLPFNTVNGLSLLTQTRYGEACPVRWQPAMRDVHAGCVHVCV
jgi:hypothetical protein